MINYFTQAIYNRSPIWIQNSLCTIEGWRLNRIRYGQAFERWAEFYSTSRSWSEIELEAYQREQLIELIHHCFTSVPYYREKWRSMGFSPRNFKDLADLPKLPYTTKEEAFNFSDQMVSDRYRSSKLVRGMTGGSTGMPLIRYFTTGELQRHYAIFWDRMRQGVKRDERYAAFQGKEIVPQYQASPPYWRENYAANQRLYSMRHLSYEKLKYYADSLISEPFAYYQGYVSIMMIMAEFMFDNGIDLIIPPKAVFTTSEQLTKATRQLFETVWKTKVWDEYCQGERCALIRQCEYGNYHPQMEYGVIEFETIANEGDYTLAEMICTGFIPQAAPLIRYRVGDRVLLDKGAKCPCAAPGPVIKAIRGRVGDYILTPDGRKYPHISLIVDMLRNVRRTQVIQERLDTIIVNIVPYPQFCKADEMHLIRCFKEKIGGNIEVVVCKVNTLERMQNGKFLSIINRLSGNRPFNNSEEEQ